MHSRAFMLLDREYSKLQEEVTWGIRARPSDDSLFQWVAKINGPKDTIWEGGIFVVNLKFTEHFNQQPPQVNFHTIPFHPNIDMENGRPCVDFLDEFGSWKESYSILSILITLQQLLANPILENPVNEEAASLLCTSPHKYRQMVLDCVGASQRINATGMTLTQEDGREVARPRVKFEVQEDSAKTAAAVQGSTLLFKPLSFDEYHTTWQGIATSKPSPHATNPLLETLKSDSKLQTIHFGLQLDELQDQMSKQLNEHNSMMYGNFGGRMDGKVAKDKRMSQISKMRKIYLQTNKAAKSPRENKSLEVDEQVPVTSEGEEEPWEKEVDDIIEWTNKLEEVKEVGEV